jgi:hypothetical protein
MTFGCWSYDQTQSLRILGLPLGNLKTKSHLDVAPVERCRVYYKGEGGGLMFIFWYQVLTIVIFLLLLVLLLFHHIINVAFSPLCCMWHIEVLLLPKKKNQSFHFIFLIKIPFFFFFLFFSRGFFWLFNMIIFFRKFQRSPTLKEAYSSSIAYACKKNLRFF